MNKVILTGNLCKDVELKQTQGGVNVVTNTIAVRRDFKGSTGEYESDFIPFVAWRQQADYLNTYALKGDKVELVGRWQVRKYQDQQGYTKEVNEVVVESISILSSNRKVDANEPTSANEPVEVNPSDLGELPF